MSVVLAGLLVSAAMATPTRQPVAWSGAAWPEHTVQAQELGALTERFAAMTPAEATESLLALQARLHAIHTARNEAATQLGDAILSPQKRAMISDDVVRLGIEEARVAAQIDAALRARPTATANASEAQPTEMPAPVRRTAHIAAETKTVATPPATSTEPVTNRIVTPEPSAEVRVAWGERLVIEPHEHVARALAIGGDLIVLGQIDGDATAVGGDVFVLRGASVGGSAISLGGTPHPPVGDQPTTATVSLLPGTPRQAAILGLALLGSTLLASQRLRGHGERSARTLTTHPIASGLFGTALLGVLSVMALGLTRHALPATPIVGPLLIALAAPSIAGLASRASSRFVQGRIAVIPVTIAFATLFSILVTVGPLGFALAALALSILAGSSLIAIRTHTASIVSPSDTMR